MAGKSEIVCKKSDLGNSEAEFTGYPITLWLIVISSKLHVLWSCLIVPRSL